MAEPFKWVALYAAIVSTGVLVMHVLNFLRERPRLRVRAKADMFTSETGDEPMIVIEAANVGRRQVNLALLPYLKIRGHKTAGLVVKGQWKPKADLKESESAILLCKQEKVDLSQISYVVVRDQIDRTWKGKIIRSKKNG